MLTLKYLVFLTHKHRGRYNGQCHRKFNINFYFYVRYEVYQERTEALEQDWAPVKGKTGRSTNRQKRQTDNQARQVSTQTGNQTDRQAVRQVDRLTVGRGP